MSNNNTQFDQYNIYSCFNCAKIIDMDDPLVSFRTISLSCGCAPTKHEILCENLECRKQFLHKTKNNPLECDYHTTGLFGEDSIFNLKSNTVEPPIIVSTVGIKEGVNPVSPSSTDDDDDFSTECSSNSTEKEVNEKELEKEIKMEVLNKKRPLTKHELGILSLTCFEEMPSPEEMSKLIAIAKSKKQEHRRPKRTEWKKLKTIYTF